MIHLGRSLLAAIFLFSFVVSALPADAALVDQINQAFRQVYGRNPSTSEWIYWADRVNRGDKTTYSALVGAMGYQKANNGGNTPVVAAAINSNTPAVSGFKVSAVNYPSPHNPNFLPNGTLIKSPTKPQVYFIRDGKKSWVIPGVLDRWLNENHFFKSDIIITVSDTDLARYPQTTSVNKIYIGKVLVHPNGTKYYIDDKLRKRPISDAVRGALKFPSGNLYPTSTVHLSEFPTGPAITKTDSFPGGMAIYDGPFHGGRIWKTLEATAGTISKHLYLKDRFYEADGYPDESQRVPANAAVLARHPRGFNIDKYPDGWVVGIGTNIYLMQKGALRLIASPAILAAMGYKPSQVRKEYPELYRQYAQGTPITAFKGIVATGTTAAAQAAPNTANNLTKVRPAIRTIIGQMNEIYRSVFDKEVTDPENKFWIDYVYNGEVNNKEDLLVAMRRTKSTGKKPALTSRTAVIDEEVLEAKWFTYLFYFVHQKEPSPEDKNYWFGRIRPGDRDTIEKLGGTLQWLKDTTGQTSK